MTVYHDSAVKILRRKYRRNKNLPFSNDSKPEVETFPPLSSEELQEITSTELQKFPLGSAKTNKQCQEMKQTVNNIKSSSSKLDKIERFLKNVIEQNELNKAVHVWLSIITLIVVLTLILVLYCKIHSNKHCRCEKPQNLELDNFNNVNNDNNVSK